MWKLNRIRKFALLALGVVCLLILTIGFNIASTISNENNMELINIDGGIRVRDINYTAFSNNAGVAKALAENNSIRAFSLFGSNFNYDKAKVVFNTITETSSIDLCYLMNIKGKVIASSFYKHNKNLKIEGENYSFRPYFIEALKGKAVIYPALGVTTKVPGIYFSYPVRDNDKQVIGVVTCKIGMEIINKVLAASKYKTIVTNSDGIVFATNDEKFLYKSVFSGSIEELYGIMESKQFSNILIRPLNLSVKNNTAVLDSKKYFISKTEIGSTGWYMLTFIDSNGKILLKANQKTFLVIIVVILMILISTIVILINSVVKRMEYEANLKKLHQAVEQSSSTIVITDRDGKIEYANPKFVELTGYSVEEAMHKNTSILKSGEHDDEFYKKMWNTIISGENWNGNICNKKKNGELYWEEANISSVKNDKGLITNFIAVKEDITKRMEFDEKLNIFATVDEMTGTLNRRSGMMLVEKQLQIAARQEKEFVIFFMDINGLKSVNDQLGHNNGDALITSGVNIIKSSLRESDSICRLGGDEFLIILPDTNLSLAETVLNRISNATEELNNENKYPFILSMSFGVAQYIPGSETTIDELIHEADENMYINKSSIKRAWGPRGILR